MTSAEPRAAQGAGMGRGLTAALVVMGVIGVAAVLYVIVSALAKPGEAGGLAGLNHGTMAKLEIVGEPATPPPVSFVDADGKPFSLASFKGRAVVLNLWATWCPPCVKEMPTLQALQRAEAGKPVKVVTVSMDSPADTKKAEAFMAAHPPLPFYQDVKMSFLSDFDPRPQGFPTTYLIDREGRVRAIYSGEADWASPDARAAADRLAGL